MAIFDEPEKSVSPLEQFKNRQDVAKSNLERINKLRDRLTIMMQHHADHKKTGPDFVGWCAAGCNLISQAITLEKFAADLTEKGLA